MRKAERRQIKCNGSAVNMSAMMCSSLENRKICNLQLVWNEMICQLVSNREKYESTAYLNVQGLYYYQL